MPTYIVNLRTTWKGKALHASDAIDLAIEGAYKFEVESLEEVPEDE